MAENLKVTIKKLEVRKYELLNRLTDKWGWISIVVTGGLVIAAAFYSRLIIF